MADPIMKEAMHDTEGLEGKTGYREGAIAGEGGETKRGLKSRHIQFLYVVLPRAIEVISQVAKAKIPL